MAVNFNFVMGTISFTLISSILVSLLVWKKSEKNFFYYEKKHEKKAAFAAWTKTDMSVFLKGSANHNSGLSTQMGKILAFQQTFF